MCFVLDINMAITRNKKDSLVDVALTADKVLGDDKKSIGNKLGTQINKPYKEAKKPGFIKTTIEELRKVNWPGLSYVLRWSSIIILFTVLVSLSLGLFDHIFTGGMKFVDCTSPSGRKQTVQSCGQELSEYLTFRRS